MMDNYTGKRLDGRYEIQEVIGVGGMAVVYKAYDNIDDRTVAVKILKEEFLANEEFRRRFKNESKAIAVLSHPNIVKVYDVSYGDRLQYIVMEYVEGITLKEYIEQQGRLAIKETVHFVTQILRALQHAHDKGIVHRDIKPQNIMLLSNGNIKVTDFGIARFSYSETKTMTDSAIGSVHYISPEQARGDITDDKADIYSVGVVMYEMLTGQLPFQSDNSVSVALMQLQSDPQRPRELNSSIPVGLEQIVMHAMQKNVKDRYQSAAEMLLDIEEFKRNPQVRFREDFFVDTDPTKYVTPAGRGGRAPASVEPVVMPSSRKGYSDSNIPPIDDIYDGPSEPAKKRTLPILIGVGIGLAVVAVITFAVLFFFTDVFNKGTITVDKFVNKNYELDVKNNETYSKKYKFELEYIANSMYEDGVICAQVPSPGVKIDSNDNTVKLTIAKTEQKILVPDVYGRIVTQAQRMLENKGFKVVLTPQVSMTEEDGMVIKTSPDRNTETIEGATITVFYASTEELIEVPPLVGWDVETARALLISLGLVLAEPIEEKPSDKPKGEVIEQNYESGAQVIAGTPVSITVSSGVPESTTGTLTISLPDTSAKGVFEVYVRNESIINKTLLMDGSEYTFEIVGSGSDANVKVFIDNSEYFTCKVDFTKQPISVTGQSYSSKLISPALNRSAMPYVIGMTEERARESLRSAYFTNVNVSYQTVSDPSKVGFVLSQSPSASTIGVLGLTTTYPRDTMVNIVVGTAG